MAKLVSNFKPVQGDFYDFFLDYTKSAIELARDGERRMKDEGRLDERAIRECEGGIFLMTMKYFYKTMNNIMCNDGHFNIDITHLEDYYEIDEQAN